MDIKELEEKLEGHEKRIARLEKEFPNSPLSNKPKKGETLSDQIINLRNDGFFSEPKISTETHKKLQENYHCELNRVEVVLTRLAKKKQLRRASKTVSGKKYKSYVW